MNDQSPVEQMGFEAAYQELEQVLAVLENEELALEQALEVYARGQSLARHCANLLDKAELRLQMLSGATLSDLKLEE